MSNAITRSEKRSSLENPSFPLGYPAEWGLDMWGGNSTDSGLRVSELTSLQYPAVLTCVQLIASAVASLPLRVLKLDYVRGRASKTPDFKHPLFDKFVKSPNPEMTAHTWKSTVMAHALLWGNSYSEIVRKDNGDISAIYPLNPSQTRPVRSPRTEVIQDKPLAPYSMFFETQVPAVGHADTDDVGAPIEKTQRIRLLRPENVLHVPGLSMDGRIGLQTIYLCRQIIGLSLAQEKLAAQFFGNGSVPAGIITFANQMEAKADEEFKRQWAEAYGGEGAQKTAVIGPGISYTKLGTDADKSQLLESRQFQRVEIASVFQVPPHMVGDHEAKGRETAEQNALEFLLLCLQGWLISIEQEIVKKIFLNVRGQKRIVQFNTNSLRYPDAATRSTFYNSGRNFGYLSTNDINEFEGRNHIEAPWADAYLMPREYCFTDDPPASVKGPKALAAFAALHPDAEVEEITTPTKTDGAPGLITPNGGRPIGQHGMRSITRMEVNKDGGPGTHYEMRSHFEYRDNYTDAAADIETGQIDVLFDCWAGLMKDHLNRMTDRKSLTFQKWDASLRPLAEAILAVDGRDGSDTVRTIQESYDRWKEYKGGRISDEQAKAELDATVASLRRDR
jgi:HK97 family phage portal protein